MLCEELRYAVRSVALFGDGRRWLVTIIDEGVVRLGERRRPVGDPDAGPRGLWGRDPERNAALTRACQNSGIRMRPA